MHAVESKGKTTQDTTSAAAARANGARASRTGEEAMGPSGSLADTPGSHHGAAHAGSAAPGGGAGADALPRPVQVTAASRWTIQPRLRVNTPGDAFEREAENVADRVMGMSPHMPGDAGASDAPADPRGTASSAFRAVQRTSAGADASSGPDASAGAAAPAIVHDVLGSSGQPLDSSTRNFMEPRFGRDLAHVRVHADARAAQSADAVNARAYTVGSDIVFARGEYAPAEPGGQRLLAHELTHVFQQGEAAGGSGMLQRQERPADEMDRVQIYSKSDNNAASSRWKHADGSSTSYADAYEEKTAIELKKEFNQDVTRVDVLKMIDDAKAKGDLATAEDYRKRLFRANTYAVIEALNVDRTTGTGKADGSNAQGRLFSSEFNHPVYGKTTGQTYCNVYACDVVAALGAYVPRVWWTQTYEQQAIAAMQKKEPFNVTPVYGKNIVEMNANALAAWFPRVGQYFHWEKAESMQAAQEAANNGNVVVLVAANKVSTHSGHIAVIIPEREQLKAERDNGDVSTPLTSQAGASNWKYSTSKTKWWEDSNHKDGAAWIHTGAIDSPLMNPEEMGGAGGTAQTTTPDNRNTAANTVQQANTATKTTDQTTTKATVKTTTQQVVTPDQFFKDYAVKAQNCLDVYYNQNSTVWADYRKNHPDLMLTGQDLADAARSVYDEQSEKDLKLIAPAEIAVAQALNEGGLRPSSSDSDLAINPFNVNKTDGGVKGKSAKNLDQIKKDEGWKAVRKKGIANYYRTMYTKFMKAKDSPEKLLAYDSFNGGSGTEYSNRYATAFYYEAKIAASVGLMEMSADKKLLSGSVGGTKGNSADDLKAVYTYIKSYDTYPGKLQKDVNYADYVKLDAHGVPTADSIHTALYEIQDNEIYPAESTFSDSKTKVAENMKSKAPADYKQQVEARTSGRDGVASRMGTTIGYLYYYHKLVTEGKVFGSTVGTDVSPTTTTTTTTTKTTPKTTPKTTTHKTTPKGTTPTHTTPPHQGGAQIFTPTQVNTLMLAGARKVHYAMFGGTGIGTDEDTVYSVLSTLHNDGTLITQFKSVYRKEFGTDLEADIRSEFSDTWLFGNELTRALSYLKPKATTTTTKGASTTPGGTTSTSPVPIYKQGDRQWGSRTLGKSETISSAGCAMTAMAMAVSAISGKQINPMQKDQYLDTHGGYSGDLIIWEKAAQAGGLHATKHGFDLAVIDQSLAAGKPCVISVNGRGHWVTVIGKHQESGHAVYTIHDPATGKETNMDSDGTKLVGRAGDYSRKSASDVITLSK
ncbi:MAG TPA: DUF4157 domain-containing protein [Candidatus Kapabacteria bacterium]|nr:DUF4157 domain-containing protein [Candidatus Kapabacteria bacterium]